MATAITQFDFAQLIPNFNSKDETCTSFRFGTRPLLNSNNQPLSLDEIAEMIAAMDDNFVEAIETMHDLMDLHGTPCFRLITAGNAVQILEEKIAKLFGKSVDTFDGDYETIPGLTFIPSYF